MKKKKKSGNMCLIRYDSLTIGSRSHCGVLKLSDCNDCLLPTWELGKMMLAKSKKWIIEGEEPFNQINALYELVKYLRNESRDVLIHIKSYTYNYTLLRCASKTDELLDMCDYLTDTSGSKINLRRIL